MKTAHSNHPSSSTPYLRNSTQLLLAKYSLPEYELNISLVNGVILGKESLLKTTLKDNECNQGKDVVQSHFKAGESRLKLKELAEYYKYYTQTPVIFHSEVFSIMNLHHEKRKAADYDRLKVIFNLEDSYLPASPTPFSSFNILTRIDTNQSESSLFAGLHAKLEKHIGTSKRCSIQELDRKFYFEKKENKLKNHRTFQRSIDSRFPCKTRNNSLETISSKTGKNCKLKKKRASMNFQRTLSQPSLKEFNSVKNKEKISIGTPRLLCRTKTSGECAIKLKIMRMKNQIKKQTDLMRRQKPVMQETRISKPVRAKRG